MQVTIGEEGFFGPGDPHDSCNPGYPGSTWPQQSGQDFTNNHKNEAIDFAVRTLFDSCHRLGFRPREGFPQQALPSVLSVATSRLV